MLEHLRGACMMVLLVSLTTFGILEFIEHLGIELKSVLAEAGLGDVNVVVWPDVVKPPAKCFSWERAQYHANCLAKYLRDLFQVVGLTGRAYIIGAGYLDGYEYGLNFVFGEALPECGVAVVFTKRLRPEFYGMQADFNLYLERLVKETVHELGHLFGLGHCTNDCVMKFSNSVIEVDRKPRYYCESCKDKIRRLHMSSTK